MPIFTATGEFVGPSATTSGAIVTVTATALSSSTTNRVPNPPTLHGRVAVTTAQVAIVSKAAPTLLANSMDKTAARTVEDAISTALQAAQMLRIVSMTLEAKFLHLSRA